MGLTAFTVSILLGAGAPAVSAPVPSDEDTFTWCVVEGASAKGKLRYFSDVFEGSDSPDVRAAFSEYVHQAYPAARTMAGSVATCSTAHGRAAADGALDQARTPRSATVDVATAWRTHFE